VPTWNYAAVQVHGRVATFTDRQRLRDLVEQLTALHEAAEWEPWTPRYDLEKLDYIVGIEMRVADVEAKFKLSQNRTAADRLRVIESLRARRSDHSAQIAALMMRRPPAADDDA